MWGPFEDTFAVMGSEVGVCFGLILVVRFGEHFGPHFRDTFSAGGRFLNPRRRNPPTMLASAHNAGIRPKRLQTPATPASTRNTGIHPRRWHPPATLAPTRN